MVATKGGAREPIGGTDGMECHSNPHRATVLEDDGYEADREEAKSLLAQQT